MGKASRDKGKRWERQVCRDLRAIYGPQVRRGWQSRYGGKDERDIMDADPFWHYEAKHHKRVGYRAAMRQATADAEGTDRRPVVVAKDDRHEPVVYLYWKDWLWLQQLLLDCGAQGGSDDAQEQD